MKILITGATGMVGAAIAKKLALAGEEVTILARSPEKAKTLFTETLDIRKGDVTDKDSLEQAVKGKDIVYHAAGLPEQWFRDPSIFTKTNVDGTRNVLDVSLRSGVKRVVYTSTIDVFQAEAGQKYDESILDPNPKGTYYERSKQEADRIAVEYLNKGLDIVFTHPSGVFGTGPSSSPGTNGFIKDLILGKIPMLLPGGFPVVFSEDCADGHILAAKKAKTGARYILSDTYLSLSDFAKLVSEIRPLKKIPKVMPLGLAKTVSIVGEAVSFVIGKPPLLPKGQLHFMQWQAIPVADKAKTELGWKPLPTKEAVSLTIKNLFPE
ncbi:SDR family NAD(P)-dependent oxidoreductase [Leptospira idonii]|uniref:SDR family NAD(P)-dependent oxidoreductase n=1 Tax=Leptospira idonii TaxID=1193500 RepID=A0A4R9LWA9_9LEPT|nr:SDR family NAD(P)-dependent oxidoreductase [Leptospira idonii]TGN17363.1 SDR family NAD(P)-dependent oxidoreductase [Leptospira idonii]